MMDIIGLIFLTYISLVFISAFCIIFDAEVTRRILRVKYPLSPEHEKVIGDADRLLDKSNFNLLKLLYLRNIKENIYTCILGIFLILELHYFAETMEYISNKKFHHGVLINQITGLSNIDVLLYESIMNDLELQIQTYKAVYPKTSKLLNWMRIWNGIKN